VLTSQPRGPPTDVSEEPSFAGEARAPRDRPPSRGDSRSERQRAFDCLASEASVATDWGPKLAGVYKTVLIF